MSDPLRRHLFHDVGPASEKANMLNHLFLDDDSNKIEMVRRPIVFVASDSVADTQAPAAELLLETSSTSSSISSSSTSEYVVTHRDEAAQPAAHAAHQQAALPRQPEPTVILAVANYSVHDTSSQQDWPHRETDKDDIYDIIQNERDSSDDDDDDDEDDDDVLSWFSELEEEDSVPVLHLTRHPPSPPKSPRTAKTRAEMLRALNQDDKQGHQNAQPAKKKQPFNTTKTRRRKPKGKKNKTTTENRKEDKGEIVCLDTDGTPLYKFEAILDHRFTNKGDDEFQVKWVNYEAGEDLNWYPRNWMTTFTESAIRSFKIRKYGSLEHAEEVAAAAKLPTTSPTKRKPRLAASLPQKRPSNRSHLNRAPNSSKNVTEGPSAPVTNDEDLTEFTSTNNNPGTTLQKRTVAAAPHPLRQVPEERSVIDATSTHQKARSGSQQVIIQAETPMPTSPVPQSETTPVITSPVTVRKAKPTPRALKELEDYNRFAPPRRAPASAEIPPPPACLDSASSQVLAHVETPKPRPRLVARKTVLSSSKARPTTVATATCTRVETAAVSPEARSPRTHPKVPAAPMPGVTPPPPTAGLERRSAQSNIGNTPTRAAAAAALLPVQRRQSAQPAGVTKVAPRTKGTSDRGSAGSCRPAEKQLERSAKGGKSASMQSAVRRKEEISKHGGKIVKIDADDNEPYYLVESVTDYCQINGIDHYRLKWEACDKEDLKWYPVYQLTSDARQMAEEFAEQFKGSKSRRRKRLPAEVEMSSSLMQSGQAKNAPTSADGSACKRARRGLVNGVDSKGRKIYEVEKILEHRQINGIDKYRLKFAHVAKEDKNWFAESSLKGLTREMALQFKKQTLQRGSENRLDVSLGTEGGTDCVSVRHARISCNFGTESANRHDNNTNLALTQLRALLACAYCHNQFSAITKSNLAPCISRRCNHAVCVGCLKRQSRKGQSWLPCPVCQRENCFSCSGSYSKDRNTEIVDLIESLESKIGSNR